MVKDDSPACEVGVRMVGAEAGLSQLTSVFFHSYLLGETELYRVREMVYEARGRGSAVESDSHSTS